MRALAFLLLLSACAAQGRGEAGTLYVDVRSANWYAKWVTVYCSPATQLGRIYGIEMGGHYQKRVHIGNCTEIVVAITRLDGSAFILREHLVSVGQGERLCVEIAPSMRHSRAWNCTNRT